MMGLKGDDGRWIQDTGEVPIICIGKPRHLLSTPIFDVAVQFYSNNEPHIHLQSNFKEVTGDVIKFCKMVMKELCDKFNSLGYDRLYTLVPETDIQTGRIMVLVGFIPEIIYQDDIGRKSIKYYMETEQCHQ